jgi:hypothetical protein
MIIRKVTKKDLLDIWLWRNNKKTIYFSKSKKKISLNNHTKWFYKILLDSKIKIYKGYFVKKNKIKKIGIVRFDIKHNKYAYVSINLNPIMRGKKLSYILLFNAIKKFLKFKKIILVAEINKKNFSSIKCFLKNKFYLYKSNNQYKFYKRNLN